jgi:hypothetical protein
LIAGDEKTERADTGSLTREPLETPIPRGKRISLSIGGLTMKLSKMFSAFLLIVVFAFFAGCASTSKQAGTGEYIDDTVITTKVKAAILGDDTLKVMEINVETFKGVVQLSGFVVSPADINRATEVARTVKGVTSVKNDIRLK